MLMLIDVGLMALAVLQCFWFNEFGFFCFWFCNWNELRFDFVKFISLMRRLLDVEMKNKRKSLKSKNGTETNNGKRKEIMQNQKELTRRTMNSS